MEITSKVMLVTPEMATKWLANTIGNRHINKERVKTYVNDIKKGWVKFLKNNSLPLNI